MSFHPLPDHVRLRGSATRVSEARLITKESDLLGVIEPHRPISPPPFF